MKFSSRVEVDAPAPSVFAELSDFVAIDALAQRRAILVRRTDTLAAPGPGMSWLADFRFRGRMRHMDVTLTRFETPEVMEYHARTPGFEILCLLQLVALARARTRVIVTLEVRPRTLGARLLMQSARLGRSALERRFDERIHKLGERLDEMLNRG
ncbi:SRPBCC family protein [Paenirhodobacter enshiensis]|uniref:SRPBCC family protein n=1 Tax=Paenirhodobacter enshiensis TaxID=1105367 RepID=UPI003FA289CC